MASEARFVNDYCCRVGGKVMGWLGSFLYLPCEQYTSILLFVPFY